MTALDTNSPNKPALDATAPHKLMNVYREALDSLRGRDLEERCRAAGYDWDPHSIRLSMLGRPFVFSVPDLCLEAEEEDRDTSVAGADSERLTERILLLHYLRLASGALPSGRRVGFDQLAGGRYYGGNFHKRAEAPLARIFSGQPERLLAVAQRLGGTEANYGDVSVEILPFPRVSMTLILWTGDDEMPSNGKVLFDDTVEGYLSTEDIAVLGDSVIRRLRELLGTQEESCRKS